jgi:hypothetical protein
VKACRLWALCVLCLLPWLYFEARMSVGGDVAWLSITAQRILAGERMTDRYYDPDPPLCLMLYLPVALLMKTGLPLWRASFVYVLAVMACSYALTARLLRAVPGLNAPRYWGVMVAFMIATTFPAIYSFGQKDQLIGIVLFPFLLAQYAMTRRLPVSPWIVRAAIILGIPFILAKPHYGLLPVLLLAHRAVRQKRVSVILDFDFLALTAGVLGYAVLLALFFRDFLTEALPVSLLFYVSEINAIIIPVAVGLGIFSACIAVLAWAGDERETARPAAIFFCLMGMAAVIPVVAQFKGFSMHMLPALAVLGPAAFLSVSLHMKILARAGCSASAVVAVLFALAYLAMPPNLQWPGNKDYPNTSWARYVSTHAAGASFFMQTDSTEILYPVSVYTGIPVASRFPCLWFLPGLSSVKGTPKLDALRAKFASYTAEDFARYRPALVALYTNPAPGHDLIAAFGSDPAFAREWSHYRLTDTFIPDYREYFRGTRFEDPAHSGYARSYSIYMRKD